MEKCSSCRAPHHVCAVFRCLFWVVSSSGFHGDGRKREEDGSCLPPPEGFQSFFKGRRAGSGSTLLIRQRDHDGPGVAHSAPRISLPQLPWRSGGTALTANGGFPTAPQRKALTREREVAMWEIKLSGCWKGRATSSRFSPSRTRGYEIGVGLSHSRRRHPGRTILRGQASRHSSCFWSSQTPHRASRF